jgi:hypothetical protein
LFCFIGLIVVVGWLKDLIKSRIQLYVSHKTLMSTKFWPKMRFYDTKISDLDLNYSEKKYSEPRVSLYSQQETWFPCAKYDIIYEKGKNLHLRYLSNHIFSQNFVPKSRLYWFWIKFTQLETNIFLSKRNFIWYWENVSCVIRF